MGWLDTIGSVIDIGGGISGQLGKQDDRGAVSDYLRWQELNNWKKANADYEMAKAGQAASAANSAASARNASAARGAAMATEKNRQKAAKKSLKTLMKGFDDTKAVYDPYVKTASALLPQMQGAYSGGLQNLAALSGQAMKLPTQQSVSSWNTGVPIPDYLRGK